MITGFDHIVLNVRDVHASFGFNERILGMQSREEQPGKWALHFGAAKISLQTPDSIPDMAHATSPGSANFGLVTEQGIDELAKHLKANGVEVRQRPGFEKGHWDQCNRSASMIRTVIWLRFANTARGKRGMPNSIEKGHITGFSCTSQSNEPHI